MTRGTESPEYAAIKPWFFEAVEMYVEHRRIEEDAFADIVIGDVKAMVSSLDADSQRTLWLMLKYLYNHAPSDSWGSLDAVKGWLKP